VLICMFVYAIVKEMETAIYPWLKSYNAKNKYKVSYWDIINELKNKKNERTRNRIPNKTIKDTGIKSNTNTDNENFKT